MIDKLISKYEHRLARIRDSLDSNSFVEREQNKAVIEELCEVIKDLKELK